MNFRYCVSENLMAARTSWGSSEGVPTARRITMVASSQKNLSLSWRLAFRGFDKTTTPQLMDVYTTI